MTDSAIPTRVPGNNTHVAPTAPIKFQMGPFDVGDTIGWVGQQSGNAASGRPIVVDRVDYFSYDFADASTVAKRYSAEHPGASVYVVRSGDQARPPWPGATDADGPFEVLVSNQPLPRGVGTLSFSGGQYLPGKPVIEQVYSGGWLRHDRDPSTRPTPGSPGSHTDPGGEYTSRDWFAETPVNIAARARELMRTYDADGDGVIARYREDSARWQGGTSDIRELARVADEGGNNDGRIDQAEIERVLRGFDDGYAGGSTAGDGMLGVWELKRWMDSGLDEGFEHDPLPDGDGPNPPRAVSG